MWGSNLPKVTGGRLECGPAGCLGPKPTRSPSLSRLAPRWPRAGRRLPCLFPLAGRAPAGFSNETLLTARKAQREINKGNMRTYKMLNL